MTKNNISTWAIRDIKHGKTFHFQSYDKMAMWIFKGYLQLRNDISFQKAWENLEKELNQKNLIKE